MLVTVRNEGGVTPSYDISEALQDEIAGPDVDAARHEIFFTYLLGTDTEESVLKMLKGVPVTESEESKAIAIKPADPNTLFDEAQEVTALHLAAGADLPSMVKLLLEAGADPNARTVGGRTPLQAAVDDGAETAAEVLRQWTRSSA